MKKLLVICGPTATGKTNLGLKLAKKYDGELVSADSRQVYRHMDIGTGKSLPKGAKQKSKGYYLIDSVKVWGYDLVNPKSNFSVANYVRVTSKILKDIWQRKKLPILVGGTGFYIKGIIDGIETVSFPPNVNLRKTLEKKSAKELFEILAQLNPIKAAALNVSDRGNARRLIRAIEISDAQIRGKRKAKKKFTTKDTLLIGLTASNSILGNNIDRRVKERIKKGFEREIQTLFKKGVSWQMQSMTSLGYRQFRDYIEGKEAKEKAVERWKVGEKRYAKRQLIWFRKDKRINWFDIEIKGYQKRIEKMVDKWYKLVK